MSRHVRPFIRRDGDKISTETPYNQNWVDAIKYCIPLSARVWGGGVWSFDPRYYSCVRTIMEHFFGSTVIDSTGGISEPQLSGWKERWDVFKDGKVQPKQNGWNNVPDSKTKDTLANLWLISDAPSNVIKAVYRTLCTLFHPDKGGDPEVMKRINEAYDTLKKQGRVD